MPDYYSANLGDFHPSFDPTSAYDRFILDHCIDGRILYPATGYLAMIWNHLTNQAGYTKYQDTTIEIWKMTIHRATMITNSNITTFTVNYSFATSEFSIRESDTLCVTGYGRIGLSLRPVVYSRIQCCCQKSGTIWYQ